LSVRESLFIQVSTIAPYKGRHIITWGRGRENKINGILSIVFFRVLLLSPPTKYIVLRSISIPIELRFLSKKILVAWAL
jgi:hypothetical protein